MSVSKNFYYRAGAEVAIKGLTLLLTVLLARWMGPQTWGLMQTSQAFCLFFGTLAELGLNSLVVREIAQAKDDRQRGLWLEAACLAKAVLWTAAAVLMAATSFGLPADSRAGGLLLSAAFMVVAFTLDEMNTALFSSIERLDVDFWISVASKGLQIALGLGAFLVFGSPQAVQWGMGGAAWTAWAVGGLILYRLFRLKPALPFKAWPLARKLLVQLWPFGLVSLLTAFYSQADRILLERLKGAGEVGIYMGAIKWLENSSFVPAAFIAAVFPSLSRGAGGDRSADIENRSLRLTGAAGALFCVVLLSLAPFLSDPLLFGSKYQASVPLLGVLAFACLARFPNFMWLSLLIAKGRQNLVLWGVGSGAALNLAGNLLLQPRYGARAAAWMVLATEAVVFVSAAWCLRDKMAPAKWARWLAPCLLAAFAGLGLQKLLAPLVHPALSAPACLGLCVLILSVTDVVDKRDWKKLLPWI